MEPVALGLNSRHLAGAVLQSLALAVADNGDVNTSCATRAIGTLIVALLLSAGTLLAAAAPLRLFALLVPVVRADLVFHVVSRLVRAFIWARRLTPSNVLYANEVFPLQAAAMIWNQCRPVAPHSASEDERSALLDWLASNRELWRPTPFDAAPARALKLPFFVLLAALAALAAAFEAVLFSVWRAVFHRGARNRVPVAIDGARPEVLGHTMLLSDAQLTWVQRFATRGGAFAENREARRVALRALHTVNVLAHGGHTRLVENAPGGLAMNEFYAVVVDNELVKTLLSKYDELRLLPALPNGNRTAHGAPAPRQVVWARAIVGALHGLRARGRWRGAVARAQFAVAQANQTAFGPGTTRTALQRHVYTVLRRWLVDWTMHAWWQIDVQDDAVDRPDELFARLARVFRANTVHNTRSLPHAVGELVVSTQRAADVDAMLARVLGDDWLDWLQGASTPGGRPVRDAMLGAGEWKCAGRPVAADDPVDAALYVQMPVDDAVQAGTDSTLGTQARAVLMERVARTLVARVREAWDALPERLMDAPDAGQGGEEY